MVRWVAAMAAVLASCASSGERRPPQTPSADAVEQRPVTIRGWHELAPLERVRLAAERADVVVVATEAWRARGTDEDSPELRALGAPAALAIDCADQAIELAGETRDPALIRVVMRAHLRRDRWAEAAVVAARPEVAADEEAQSVVAVARAASGRSLWQVSGAACAETTTRTDLPVPVVWVAIDGTPVLALVDTTTHVTRISSAHGRADGVLDRMEIGGVTIEGLPYFARDLSRESALATVPIDVVLGRDVLFRWRVAFRFGQMRLGGPIQTDWFHRFGPVAPIVILGDSPAVRFFQQQTESIPRGSRTTSHELGWLVLASTRTTSELVIADRLLDDLPFGYELLTGHDRLRIRVPGLTVYDMGIGDSTVIVDERDELPHPFGGALGWPQMASCTQLGWSGLSLPCFDIHGPPACHEPIASGPRIAHECDLDALRD